MSEGLLCLSQGSQSCPITEPGFTLCDPMGCIVHGISPGQPFQTSPGDLPNPGIEPRPPTLQRILYQLSHKGSPRILE